MEIHTNRFNLDWKDTELVLKMIKAQYAKEELIQSDFFHDVIPEDYDYLKRLCEFDFTTEPTKWENEEAKKFTEEYLDWDMALNVLCDIGINIFDIHYRNHSECFDSYSRYIEYIDNRMKVWSKNRHKDDELINSIVEELIKKK